MPTTPAVRRRSPLVGALLAVVGLAVAALAGCSGGSHPAAPTTSVTPSPSSSVAAAPEGPGYYRQSLSWHRCGGGAQCATLHVPLDYSDPHSRLIDVAVLRYRATGQRIGSVIVNPGGPGGSGVDYARSKPLTARVRARFDLVGFDPRGVGRSTPVHCTDTSFLDRFLATDALPGQAAREQQVVALSRQFAQLCQQHAGDLLAHVSTVDAARDMDVLRAALGDDGLTYVGKSYGTFLGALYAQLFPTHVRALVLDGAVDPSLAVEPSGLQQAKGFETALGAFLADCAGRSTCPLGNSADGARSRLTALLDRLEDSPLPAGSYPDAGGRRLTRSLGLLGVASALYDKPYWTYLRDAIAGALGGDGSGLMQLGDALVDRSHGHYSNQTDSNTAISCLDHNAPRDPTVDLRDAVAFQRQAPLFGAFEAYGSLTCAFWPVPPVRRDQPITAPGTPPILVVGTTRDPATPFAWAVSLAHQLQHGVLLAHDGDGHTAYGNGDPCVDGTTDAYLVDLRVPKPGTRC